MYRKNGIRGFFILTVVMMMMAAGSAYFAVVDFENPSLGEGDSVEGMGAVHPYLDITPWSLGNAIVVVDSGGIKAYQGGSGAAPGPNVNNLCLEDPDILGADQGIGTTFQIPATSDATWKFAFDDAIVVQDFSIDMLDYGDWFPYGDDSGSHTATLTAYDGFGNAVASDSFTSGAKDAAKYDACGTDGIQRLGVVAPAGEFIAYVEITFDVVDTGIAFDNIEFNYECVVEYDLIADGGEYRTVPAGVSWVDVGGVRVWDDGETLFVQYFTDVDFWEIKGIHLHVADAVEGIPQKNGNPIPGKFDVKEEFDPWVTTTPIYAFTLDDYPNGPVIAAHAELVDTLYPVTEPGDYWATGWSENEQGLTNGGGVVDTTYRSDPDDLLGVPDATSGPYQGFFSLGFEGSIVINFLGPVYNGAGDDLTGVEITGTNAGYPEEKAEVWFLYDGEWYKSDDVLTNAGDDTVLQRSTFVEMPDVPYADAVKIVDVTDSALHNSAADGYDVDAVKVSQLGALREETGWGADEDFPGKNWAMYIDYTGVDCGVPNLVLRETVLVPSDGSTVSSSVLNDGSDYLLKASGTYEYWPAQLPAAGIADAHCSLRPPGSFNNTGVPAWINGDDLTGSENYLEVQTLTGPIDWNEDCNAGNVYTADVIGAGAALSLTILDSYYGDNSGAIPVKIYEWTNG